MDSVTKSVCWIRGRIKARAVVDIVIWFSVAVPVLLLFLHGTPYHRGFFCDDATLSYPYKPDTMSTSLLLVAGFAVSSAVIVVTEVLNCIDQKCRHHCFTRDAVMYCIKSYAIFLTGFILEELVTKVVKNRMGVLRPNFFDVCKPQFNRTSCLGQNYITNYTCTSNTVKEIRQSRLSFPSGHASLSMYIAVFFCIYIENRLQIRFSYILKMFLQSSLILLAFLCGLDRVLDNKHHPSDVAVGFLLGIIVAIFVHQKLVSLVINCRSIKRSGKLTLKTTNESCEWCMCATQTNDLETQTPTPLLKNDFSDSSHSENNIGGSSPIFKDTPLYVRRHFSTPITPSRRSEGII